jgi:hypothetical protein
MIKEKIEYSQVSGIELNPDTLQKYKEKSAIALMMLFLADAKLYECEELLKENGAWKLSLKKKVKTAINYVVGITSEMEKSIDKDVHGALFYADSKFLGQVADLLISSNMTKDDEIKLLSYLKNNYARK